jgi:hypothetical protein
MKCSVEDCSREVLKRNLCEAHYCKFRRDGTLKCKSIAEKGAPIRFLQDHVCYAGDDCLIWPFARPNRGMGFAKWNGVRAAASRVMCILAYGEAPFAKAEAAHTCGKAHEGCVNPKHLYWATSKENNLDRHVHGTMPIGERSGLSKLTEAQVLSIHADRRSANLVAVEYGVHRSCVEAIRYGKTWSWLTGGRVNWVAPGYETRSRHTQGWGADHPR